MKITSRVGRKPVSVPPGVEVALEGLELKIKGPKGKHAISVHPSLQLLIEDEDGTKNKLIKIMHGNGSVYFRRGSGSHLRSSITGTTRASIANVIQGVTHGFEKKLLLVGVGYRAQVKGKVLNLSVGYSHPVDFTAPEGITIETPSQTEIVIKGSDRQLVGYVAAKIRSFRSPEPYKGKGIRYENEVIELKETKKK